MAEEYDVGGEKLTLTRMDDPSIASGIPYAVTLGAVNFAGMLYIRDPIEDSYHIDKNNIDACADNGLIKACIQIDIQGKKLRAKVCTRNLRWGWDCPA